MEPKPLDTMTPQVDLNAELKGLFELTGKVAFVPGGYGGLGEAIAWALAQRGASVVVAGRDAAKAGALADTIRAAGFAASGVAMDAHSVADIRAAVDGVVERHRRTGSTS
jgi:NAD(P)-dependent dehydrogenase (short-subunit alcohol dehydrogenase family)